LKITPGNRNYLSGAARLLRPTPEIEFPVLVPELGRT